MLRAKLNTSSSIGQPVTLLAGVSNFPQPTAAGGGGNITVLRDRGGYGPQVFDISVMASAACQLDGGLGIYGEKDDGQMGFLGYLNSGTPIIFQSAAVGYNMQVNNVGIFKRLLVGGVDATVSPTAGNPTFTVKATPVFLDQRDA